MSFQILLKHYRQEKRIYFTISYYFEMTSSKISCCNLPKLGSRKRAATKPDEGLEAIERLGGIEVLSRKIPDKKDLVEKSRKYHALSDPLRLTILYLLKDQPLCVCVINRFIQIADSKLLSSRSSQGGRPYRRRISRELDLLLTDGYRSGIYSLIIPILPRNLECSI